MNALIENGRRGEKDLRDPDPGRLHLRAVQYVRSAGRRQQGPEIIDNSLGHDLGGNVPDGSQF
jgi:hypothetical protein